MKGVKLSNIQRANIRRNIMGIKLYSYGVALVEKMERGGRLEAFQKELIKRVFDPEELEFLKADKCECCGIEIEKCENRNLD